MAIQIAPLNFAFETIAANERMTMLMNHELVHVITMDQPAGADRAFRRLFGGKVAPSSDHPASILYWYLTAPRVAAPRWYHEGIAVFVDTWMAGGMGRAQGGYDEMVFRAMVRDDVPFYDPLGLVSEGTKIDFQVQANSYLYGTRFMTWLARRHTPEKLIEWVSRGEDSRGYYAAQFRKVFGMSLEQAWGAWVEDERAFQQANLAAVRKYPITPHTDVTANPLGSMSRAFYDGETGSIYAGLNYPGAVLERGADLGENRRDRAARGHQGSAHLYGHVAGLEPRGSPPLLHDRQRRAPRSGPAGSGERAHEGAAEGSSGRRSRVQRRRSITLGDSPPQRPGEPGADQAAVYRLGARHHVAVRDRDVRPRRVARRHARVGIVRGDQRQTGRAGVRHRRVARRRYHAAGAVRLRYVRARMASSSLPTDATSMAARITRACRTSSATTWRRRRSEAVSNTETGFFRPVPLADGRLLVFRYTGRGFVPAWIDPKPLEDVSAIEFLGERLISEQPVLKSWMLDSPAKVPFDTMEKTTGTYGLGGRLRRESIFPIIEGYKDTASVGVALNLSDPLMLNRLHITAGWSPTTSLPMHERLHLSADYERYDWRASASFNDADFYDLVGPTKVGRKGYSALVGHRNTLIFDEPRRLELDLSGRVSGNLDQLPDYQNVPVDVGTLVTLKAGLAYSYVRNSLGYVDEETGRKWSLELSTDVVDGEPFPKLFGTFDRGIGLRLGHSSFWMRTAAGFSPRSRTEAFSNFFFGGFGNNYVDHGDEKRYRHLESFPGVELNEIPGRNFAKATLEWNLPPWRFARLGTPGLHATWLRPAIFVTGLTTNMDDGAFRRTAVSAGGQIDVRFTILSNLDMTFSAGAAIAAEDGRPPRREAMLSLKLLR